MIKSKYLSILLIGLLVFSCKKNDVETNNIYRFKEYISFTTSGLVSVADPIQINLAKEVEGWSPDMALDKKLLKVDPYVEGKLAAVNNHALVFTPDEPLDPDTEYTVTLKLKDVYKDVSKELSEFTFQFKTIRPNFTVVTNSLQSYDREWQYLEGALKSADIISIEKAKKLIQATQNDESLAIVFNEESTASRNFDFKIDSIHREIEDDHILIKWDGEAIKADNKGENSFLIPGINNFSIIDVSVTQNPEQCLVLNFSDPLKKEQNFDGLVSIENSATPKFLVNGNVLRVYPSSKLVGNIQVDVFQGISNTEGYKLKKPFSETVSFEELKPQVRMLSSGVILPNSKELKLNFEAVNLKAVDVRVIKIFEDNVLQFLQENDFGDTYTSNLRRVGRRIAKKTIPLVQNKQEYQGKWKAYSLDLSKFFQADPGSLYRVEISFEQSYSLYHCDSNDTVSSNDEEEEYYYEEDYMENLSVDYNEDEELREEAYWDNLTYRYKNYTYNWKERENPCHSAYYHEERVVSQTLLASNLGVVAKRGNNNTYFFAVTDLLTTEPEANATVKLYNYQQQELVQSTTDEKGFTMIDSDQFASYAVVIKGRSKAYIKLNDGNSLSLSKFDVSGNKLQRGLKGYLYGERGVWRPGDTLHLAFILNDKDNELPNGHPVKLELTDPNGKMVYKEVRSEHVNQFYKFTVPTTTDDITGNYSAKVSVGGAKYYKTIKIETVKPNRLKIDLDFGDGIITKESSLMADLGVHWLHGAPGKNLKAEIKAKFTASSQGFDHYKGYTFQDPSKIFKTEELTVFEGKVDENGQANVHKQINLEGSAPGLLKAQFLVRAFENGGDFSIDAFSKTYAPYDAFVGLKMPEGNQYGGFETRRNQTFKVVLVDAQGKPLQREGLEVKVYKVEWRWWWNASYDNLSSYVSNNYHRSVYDTKLNTNSKGEGAFNLNIPDSGRGRYLIRVIDTKGGHSTGSTAYFYKNWWDAVPSGNKDAAKMLVFNADKGTYQTGETAKITFPSGEEGRALISIENGTEVLDYRWVKTEKGQTTVDIPITSEMAPNVFVNISLLQPHAVTSNDLPIRLYGVIPLMVENKDTRLHPQLDMADELKPETEFKVTVSEKNNKAMTYTLAVVDEGLLDLTRFKTPNAWDGFYAREALGVKTWDLFDQVIGAYSGSIDQVFSIGGDGSIEKGKNKKANRFKPVVMYLGPFKLEAGQKKEHHLMMPNYVGSVRAMVVAGNNDKEAYGNVEKAIPVKKPLMVLASLPRKLSPSEKVQLPVTVFAMKPHVKSVEVSLKLSEGLSIVGEKIQKINFDKPDEKMAYFELDVHKVKGIQHIEVVARGNGEKATYKVELDVLNPNPISSKSTDITLSANESKNMEIRTFGIEGTNLATVEFSTIPPMDFSRRLQYLIQYPHGCVEQTTSSVFPQLFLTDIFDLTVDKKKAIQENVEAAIKKLAYFQTSDGGMGYWMGDSEVNDWGTSYAGHFLLEAERKGYALPVMFKTNWLKYQKMAARDWRPSYRIYHSDLSQAYRLYTLALAGEPDLAAMNRLREFSEISNEAKWRLAAAYALAGQKEASQALLKTANIEFEPIRNDYYTYGSVDRNRAMALETMVLVKDGKMREFAELIAKELSGNRWMSTQTTAYSLLSIAKMVESNGGKSLKLSYILDGKTQEIETSKSMATRELPIQNEVNSLSMINKSNNVVYVRVLNSGKLPLGEELVEQRGLSVSVVYKDLKGSPIDIKTLQQGQDFLAIIQVSNLKSLAVNNVALTQIIPSGWEIINTRFTDFGAATTSEAEYIDIRDDRVSYYFDLDKKGKRDTKTFQIMLNASYLGTYYLPGIQAEAMYDDDYLVRTKGNWIKVQK